MSKITEFYLSGGADRLGRQFDDMLGMSDEQLEDSHDVVQWLFPLNEASSHNPNAPIVTAEDMQILRCNVGHATYQRAVVRFMKFFGMTFDHNGVVPSTEFDKKATRWLHAGNHNLKRVTRIIRCAVVLKLNGAAVKLSYGFSGLKDHPYGKHNLDVTTLKFWSDAATLPLDETLNKELVRKT